MAIGDKSTKAGLGDIERDKSTLSGVPIDRKKVVTKRGLVAPSPLDPENVEEFVPESGSHHRKSGVVDKSTNPGGMTPPPPLDEMQINEQRMTPEAEAHRVHAEENRAARREVATDPMGLSEAEQAMAEQIAANEDITPGEGTELDDDSEDRSRFRTAPGGGKNRISGGRESAKAYVSPVTVKPGTGDTPVTAAVKVHDVVESAVRAYQTEPSLLRRRASSLPPALPEDSRRRNYLLLGGLAISLTIAALILWFAPGFQADAQSEALSEAPVKEVGPVLETGTKEKGEESRNEPGPGPNLGSSGENAAKSPEKKPNQADTRPEALHEESTENGSDAKDTRSETKAAVKKGSKSPAVDKAAPQPKTAPASSEKSNDLWLE